MHDPRAVDPLDQCQLDVRALAWPRYQTEVTWQVSVIPAAQRSHQVEQVRQDVVLAKNGQVYRWHEACLPGRSGGRGQDDRSGLGHGVDGSGDPGVGGEEIVV